MNENAIGVAIMFVVIAVSFFSYGYNYGKECSRRNYEQRYWKVRADADAAKARINATRTDRR